MIPEINLYQTCQQCVEESVLSPVGHSICFIGPKTLDLSFFAIRQAIDSLSGFQYGELALPPATGVMLVDGYSTAGKISANVATCESDILKLQLPPVNDLVESMIGQEEATIVSGPAGVGKSVLTLNIALALGSPQIGKLWGLEVRNEVKTLFFQSENSARATQNRLHLISRDHFLSNGIKNIVFPSFGTDDIRVSKGYLGDPKFIELLLHHIEMSGAELVVIDPLISFHNGDENDNSEMRRSLDNITDVISRTKCSFLVIHHVGRIFTGKRTSYAGRGASSIGDFADNNYLFEKSYSDGHLILTNQKTRNAEEVDAMELMMDDNLVLHHMQANSSNKSLANNNTAIQALSLLGGRVTKQKDLVDQIAHLTGRSSGVSRTILLDAINNGSILAIDDPTNLKSKVYILP